MCHQHIDRSTKYYVSCKSQPFPISCVQIKSSQNWFQWVVFTSSWVCNWSQHHQQQAQLLAYKVQNCRLLIFLHPIFVIWPKLLKMLTFASYYSLKVSSAYWSQHQKLLSCQSQQVTISCVQIKSSHNWFQCVVFTSSWVCNCQLS
jgi:hypothetical protein